MHLRSFINGLSIGVVLGIFFAPDKGEETRRKISRKAAAVGDNIKDTYEDVADNVSGEIEQVKNEANKILRKVQKKHNGSGNLPENI
jgi:gas vesicle protein